MVIVKHHRHTNDIQIGPSRWIEFIDLDGRYDQAVPVDAVLAELSELWRAIELRCVAECCGFGAFDFTPEGIANATADMDVSALMKSLNGAIREVAALDSTVVVSTRLNNLADRKTLLDLLSHIRSCLPE